MSANELRPRFLPDRDSQREWGGKGAALARMIRRGFAVPPTAALGLSEVQKWLESMPEYAPAIEAWRRWSPDVADRLRALEQACLGAPMPEHWVLSAGTLRKFLCGDEPADASSELEPWPMILRSSMSVEDGASESLAGCFESVVVGQTTPELLWRGVTQVVASAFKESSVARMSGAGIDPARFRAGVVIQPYLVAELAGVCFSRDPSNPWDRDGVVEWVRGAGEALVQGTGQSWRLRKSQGAANSPLEPFWEVLWKKAARAEKIVGGPTDLEWVWDGQQLWWVQARAVATEEARLAARAPSRRWTRGLTLERFPEPLTPMGWSVLQDAFEVNLRTLDRRFGVVAKHPSDMAVSVRGVVYSDPDFFAFPSGVRIRWSKYLSPFSLWRISRVFARFVGRALMRRGGAVSRAMLKLDLIQALLGSEAQAIESSWSEHRDGSLERLRGFDLKAGNEAELLARMDALGEISRDFMEPDLAVYLIKDALNQALLALCRALGWSAQEFADLFRSFEGNRTLGMNAEWKACLEAVSRDPGAADFVAQLESRNPRPETVLGSDAHAAWLAFLERNGHSTTSWDIAMPSWGEDPAQLAGLVRAALNGSREASPKREAESLALRTQSRARLLASPYLSSGGLERVRRALARLESFMRIDEEHHFLSGLLLVPSRKLVLHGGEFLVRRGLLDRAADVFFIPIEELKAVLADPNRVLSLDRRSARRRSEWQRSREAAPPFELPAAPEAGVDMSSGSSWQGSPMSPGIVVGIAVVAEHLEQVGELAPGSILVTTSPNPALTPLYPLLGGLVSATGSALSHGFVSAREYALPAVAGISRATERIPQGARLRVDGTTGRVEVLS